MKYNDFFSLNSFKTLLIVLFTSITLNSCIKDNSVKPNFVIIFIDDLGYGDIEPFGSVINRTPNLNQMAEEGRRFTSFYAAPVCSPSRASLMTGCYPKRVSMARGSWSVVLFPKDTHGLNPDEITIAEILKKQGYATGCFGKWHLGDQPEFLPTRQGFDTYLGIPYSNDMWPYQPPAKTWEHFPPPLPILKDEEVVDIVENMDDQAQLCKRFTDAAIDFIKRNKDKPFFVYLPHAFIHHPRNARKEFINRAGETRDMDEELMRTTPDYHIRQRTRAQIEEVDWSVGEVLKTIRQLGIEKKTLVIFTSDNGGASGCVNDPLRGGKGSTWEGGMREPTIFWWPGKIPAGTSCDEISSTMDILPTLSALAGGTVPSDRVIDGKDITSLLYREKGAITPYKAFYYFRLDTLEAVRSGEWKLRLGKLYNIKEDIGEQNDIAEEHPEIVEKLNSYMDEIRNDLGIQKNCRPPGINHNPQYLEMK
jgi:arylsulfatase A